MRRLSANRNPRAEEASIELANSVRHIRSHGHAIIRDSAPEHALSHTHRRVCNSCEPVHAGDCKGATYASCVPDLPSVAVLLAPVLLGRGLFVLRALLTLGHTPLDLLLDLGVVGGVQSPHLIPEDVVDRLPPKLRDQRDPEPTCSHRPCRSPRTWQRPRRPPRLLQASAAPRTSPSSACGGFPGPSPHASAGIGTCNPRTCQSAAPRVSPNCPSNPTNLGRGRWAQPRTLGAAADAGRSRGSAPREQPGVCRRMGFVLELLRLFRRHGQLEEHAHQRLTREVPVSPATETSCQTAASPETARAAALSESSMRCGAPL